MSKRIKEDNDNALDFAKILEKFNYVDIDINLVQTNIVRFKLKNVNYILHNYDKKNYFF